MQYARSRLLRAHRVVHCEQRHFTRPQTTRPASTPSRNATSTRRPSSNWSSGTSRSTRRTLTKTSQSTQRQHSKRQQNSPEGAAPLIIDAGCGTGRSTLKLAERFPGRTVIGVDRSEARLSKGRQAPDNALLLRAELGDFWRLLNDTPDLRVEETYLLYPNPYPKTKMLKQRFQGHASLPSLLHACGRKLTVRASWRTYLDEFRLAASRAGELGIRPDLVSKGPYELSDLHDPLTLFERKYANAGVPVYELILECE